MSDLKRMEKFYDNRSKDSWSVFNCYPFFLDCKQTYILTKILNGRNLQESSFLDIGSGEGNFILKMISLGVNPKNILAVEYMKKRYNLILEKLPNIEVINDDFLNTRIDRKYDIVTLMAVLTSITDNKTRYNILKKALTTVSKGGVLILYDYFDEKEQFLNDNYRCLSLNKIKKLSAKYKVEVYSNTYLKSKYIQGLCKFGLKAFIPIVESIKIFNDSYHFVVIKNEK